MPSHSRASPAGSRNRTGAGASSPSTKNSSLSLQRGIALLREVAAAEPAGVRLTDLAARCGLHVATAHRLLGALAREKAVNFDPYSHLYNLGSSFLQIADHTREQRIKAHYRPVLERVEALTEDTVHLSTIAGSDALCIDRVDGRSPIRTNTLSIGARRPLGVGAGSLALLAALPDDRLQLVMLANEDRYANYKGMDLDEVRTLVQQTRRSGYAFNDARVISGVSAVGVAIPAPGGGAIAAVSVAAITERMIPARRKKIAKWIRDEVAQAGLPAW